MQIVIDISNWLYNAIMECKEPLYSKSLGDAVRDGTPLPVNHGRLIDADELIKWLKLYDGRYNKRFAKTPIKDIPMYDLGHRNRNDAIILKIDRISTIIEADKGGENND